MDSQTQYFKAIEKLLVCRNIYRVMPQNKKTSSFESNYKIFDQNISFLLEKCGEVIHNKSANEHKIEETKTILKEIHQLFAGFEKILSNVSKKLINILKNNLTQRTILYSTIFFSDDVNHKFQNVSKYFLFH